jgi:hypothetical protein
MSASMRACRRFRRAWLTPAILLLCAPAAGQAPVPGSDNIIPQTALSLCPALTVVLREDAPPGTALAVSADGRLLARYFHTLQGGEVLLTDRDTTATHRIVLEPPQLPPGVTWRISRADFSPAGDLFAVESTGRLSVFSAATGKQLYQISSNAQMHSYPGQLSLAGERLALVFWPPESYLAAAKPKQPVELRLYEAGSDKLLSTIPLALDTPEAWTVLTLSPGADRFAVLMRATRWTGKARLALYSVEPAKLLWRKKVSAEDVAWSGDGSQLLALGPELIWLDAGSGKQVRAALGKIRFSEYQKLRVNPAANAAAGLLARYNPFKRVIGLSDLRERAFRLWRLDTGKSLCELLLDPAAGLDAWPTARGEVVALEEVYDLRPPLRLLRKAQIVTYRVREN